MSSQEVPNIHVSHIARDLEMQVPLERWIVDPSDRAKVALTIKARSDVSGAFLGPEGYLHVRYNPAGLSKEKRDELVEHLKEKILDVILHKMEMIAKRQQASEDALLTS